MKLKIKQSESHQSKKESGKKKILKNVKMKDVAEEIKICTFTFITFWDSLSLLTHINYHFETSKHIQ